MHISALYTYPVKGCRRLAHDAAVTEPWGLAGDRRWMAIDADGVGITQRQAPALTRLRAVPRPGGLSLNGVDVAEPVDGPKATIRVFSSRPPLTARLADPAQELLTELLGRPARLAWLADPTVRPIARNARDSDRVSFADGFPVLLVNEASHIALDAGVPIVNFRPNVVVSGGAAWEEDSWVGGRIRLGEVTFRVAEGCNRCVVSTIDQETGERGREPLRTLGRVRRVDGRLLFGVNLIPEELPGETHVIRAGETVLRLS
ncbi:MOSC domain-containing protein [Actinoplanes sp. RD1]|uniref:MOSC domain-containing protein n=1 Tax=Actinoplanes sp. RD1 TaxID=3064538 RepID=UPI0027407A3A|nr:MOSC N-terminal beta barrel domain-containing protein [Actinoplanes sp. RD1]